MRDRYVVIVTHQDSGRASTSWPAQTAQTKRSSS